MNMQSIIKDIQKWSGISLEGGSLDELLDSLKAIKDSMVSKVHREEESFRSRINEFYDIESIAKKITCKIN